MGYDSSIVPNNATGLEGNMRRALIVFAVIVVASGFVWRFRAPSGGVAVESEEVSHRG
jgi:hypothetical protein